MTIQNLTPLTGGCLCGAIRFETLSNPSGVYHCHCNSCRQHTGAPMSTMAVYTTDQVAFSGKERKIYESANGVKRGFCGECGTSITWETNHPRFGPICSLHASTFDEPDLLIPEAHSFYGERLGWLDISDELPRYEGLVKISKLVRHGAE